MPQVARGRTAKDHSSTEAASRGVAESAPVSGGLDSSWVPRNAFKMVGVSVPGDGKAAHDEYKCLKCGFQTPAPRPPQHCGRTMKSVKT